MTAVILHFVKVQTLVRVFVVIIKLTESGAFTKSGSITAIATSFNNLSNLEIPAKSSRANLGVRGYRVTKFKKLRLNNFSNNQNEQAKRKDKMRKKYFQSVLVNYKLDSTTQPIKWGKIILNG